MIFPKFVDHRVFNVKDLARTRRFYSVLLGEPAEALEDSLLYSVGSTLFFFVRSSAVEKSHTEGAGLNHLAFGLRTRLELEAVQAQLTVSGIVNSGIKLDPYGSKEFVWLDDPDGLRLEFYLRPQ